MIDATGSKLFGFLKHAVNSDLEAAMKHMHWDAGFESALKWEDLPFRRKDVSDLVLLVHLIARLGCEFSVNDDGHLTCETLSGMYEWLDGMWVTVD